MHLPSSSLLLLLPSPPPPLRLRLLLLALGPRPQRHLQRHAEVRPHHRRLRAMSAPARRNRQHVLHQLEYLPAE
jgi:hypothetical protein